MHQGAYWLCCKVGSNTKENSGECLRQGGTSQVRSIRAISSNMKAEAKAPRSYDGKEVCQADAMAQLSVSVLVVQGE